MARLSTVPPGFIKSFCAADNILVIAFIFRRELHVTERKKRLKTCFEVIRREVGTSVLNVGSCALQYPNFANCPRYSLEMKQSWSTSCVPACALLKQHVSYAFTRRSWSPFIVPPLFHLSRQCVWYKYLKASNVKLDVRETLSPTIKLSSMSTARVVKWVTYGLSDIVALISERFDDGVCFYITELLSYLPFSCTLYYT